MRSLITAIARMLGITQQTPAQPMQTAGHVQQELTPQAGSKRSAQTTKLRKPSAAPTKPKQKQEVAKSTTVATKSGKKKPTVRQVAMVNQSKQTGSKSKTPVSKIRQHVK